MAAIGRGFIREEHPNCCICGEAMGVEARLVEEGFAHPACAAGQSPETWEDLRRAVRRQHVVITPEMDEDFAP